MIGNDVPSSEPRLDPTADEVRSAYVREAEVFLAELEAQWQRLVAVDVPAALLAEQLARVQRAHQYILTISSSVWWIARQGISAPHLLREIEELLP